MVISRGKMVPEEFQLNNKSQSMESKESKVTIDDDSLDESDCMDSDDSDMAPAQVDSPGESQVMENDEADESCMSSEDGKEEGGVSSGWADAMKKILSVKKPPKKKTIVLAKAKRLSMMKLKQEDEEDPNKNATENLTEKKKEWTSRGREKPNVLQKDKEKALAKIATRGIVQLFNAVKDHKKANPNKEEASLTKKRPLADMNKKQFLKMLMGEQKDEIKDEVEVAEDFEMKEEEEDQDANKWEVLKDNFLMSTKLKNWDQTENTSK